MKTRNRFIALLLAALFCMATPICASSVTATSAGVQADYIRHIKETPISRFWGEAVVRGSLPTVDGFANTALEQALNAKISAAYTALLTKAGETARTIDLSYRIIADANYVSLLLNCKSTSTFSQESYSCIVFSPKTGKILTITDVLGPNGTRLANGIIATAVKAEPKKFNATIKEITNTHDFYMENSVLYLVFDQFEIAPGAEGVVRIPVVLSNVTNLTVPKKDYYLSSLSRFGVKMIPIRLVAEAFGYEVLWNSSQSTVEVRKGGTYISSFRINENSYYVGRNTRRRLETAPELLNNRTHVPISFFEDILGILYYTDANGNIQFTAYAAK